jgi:hypothetical protein
MYSRIFCFFFKLLFTTIGLCWLAVRRDRDGVVTFDNSYDTHGVFFFFKLVANTPDASTYVQTHEKGVRESCHSRLASLLLLLLQTLKREEEEEK